MPMSTFGLGNFVLVMRELQILPTAVDIEMTAQQLAAHGRTFDVPARTAASPGRIPFDLARLIFPRMLPQHEIQGILLAIHDFDAFAGTQIVERFAGELAVSP